MLEQSSRQVKLSTPLKDDRLVFRSMQMGAELGRLYQMQLEFYSDDGSIPYHDVLGHMVSVTLDRSHGKPACFTGYVSRFGFAGSRGRRYVYRATAVPWLWMLTQTEDCRIFHRKTAPQILREVFEQNGYTDFEFQLQKEYPVYEYCVQYRESDFNFVSRLMEHEGIYYSFRHETDRHCLILADAISAHEPVTGDEVYEYFARDDYSLRRRECVYSWHPEERVKPSHVSMLDYNFKKPGADMAAHSAIQRAHGFGGMSGDMEIYDYPGLYGELSQGRHYAKTRIEERQTQQATVRAECNLRGVEVGRSFNLTMHPVPDYNVEYLVTSAQYEVYSDDYESGGNETETFRCNFTALKTDEVFRPARLTHKPLIAGPQTATVVGEDEIDCDEYGRILVLFHWDREEAISMRCRVSQNWSGNAWGGMVIPRVGMEVVVEFLEGDPDQPLVTGCVYNGRNSVPYPLPQHKTRSTFKTDTHQISGFNELRFEDKRSEEEIYVHAQKDMNIDVLDTHTTHVRNNKTELVENNRVIEVNRNHSEVVGGNMAIHVGPTHVGRYISAGVFRLVEKLGSFSKMFGLPGVLDPGSGNLTVTVEKNALEAVGLTSVHTIGIDESTFVGRTSKLNAGKEIKISAGELVRITTGKSQIEMKENGEITINGDKININASTLVKINGKVVDIN